jgi:glycosyltransferase involved in cell wall biosynthesis
MDTLSCSLIITTYNWPAALEKCLTSVKWQSILPNEVIIADDGSSVETRELTERFKLKSPFPIVHLWQEDIGKRKTRIDNIAILKTSNEYLIFIDHDIILHPHFIKDHFCLAKKNVL